MAATKRLSKRHKSLISKHISPQSISFDAEHDQPAPYEITKPLIVAQGSPPRLLLGGSALIQHLRRHPGRTIEVIELSGLTVPDRDAIRRLDALPLPKPSDVMFAVAAARRAKLPLAQIAQILPGVTTVSDASVFSSLANSPPYVVKMLDQAKLTLAHVRRFVALPSPSQLQWAERVVAGSLSVSAMVAAMTEKGRGEPSADVSAVGRKLSEKLGCAVELHWDSSTGKTSISIPWFDVESLQGILAAIGNGPPLDGVLPKRARTLTVDLESLDEFEAFVGHLLVDPES